MKSVAGQTSFAAGRIWKRPLYHGCRREVQCDEALNFELSFGFFPSTRLLAIPAETCDKEVP